MKSVCLYFRFLGAGFLLLSGCGHLKTAVPTGSGQTDPNICILEFKHITQKKRFDCGEGALAIVLTYWKRPALPDEILESIFKGRDPRQGTRAADLVDYAQNRGCHAFLLETTRPQLMEQIRKGRPVIVCRRVFPGANHYEVVVGFDEHKKRMFVANPAGGIEYRSYRSFDKSHAKMKGFSLLILP